MLASTPTSGSLMGFASSRIPLNNSSIKSSISLHFSFRFYSPQDMASNTENTSFLSASGLWGRSRDGHCVCFKSCIIPERVFNSSFRIYQSQPSSSRQSLCCSSRMYLVVGPYSVFMIDGWATNMDSPFINVKTQIQSSLEGHKLGLLRVSLILRLMWIKTDLRLKGSWDWKLIISQSVFLLPLNPLTGFVLE